MFYRIEFFESPTFEIEADYFNVFGDALIFQKVIENDRGGDGHYSIAAFQWKGVKSVVSTPGPITV